MVESIAYSSDPKSYASRDLSLADLTKMDKSMGRRRTKPVPNLTVELRVDSPLP